MMQHDDAAIPLVMRGFAAYGFEGGGFGVENDAERQYVRLMRLSDPTSIMLRFRPDWYVSHPRIRSVIVEVKSESKGSPNFAIEERSYQAMRLWNGSGRHVMVAAVSLQESVISACWADDLPTPRAFLCPGRWDVDEHLGRLAREWPGVPCRQIEAFNGSGTPFFLVAKTDQCWRALGVFILQELLL